MKAIIVKIVYRKMNIKQLKNYKKYKSVEARNAVDYIYGICEKCFTNGLLSKQYPDNEVDEIVESIANELEHLMKK